MEKKMENEMETGCPEPFPTFPGIIVLYMVCYDR